MQGTVQLIHPWIWLDHITVLLSLQVVSVMGGCCGLLWFPSVTVMVLLWRWPAWWLTSNSFIPPGHLSFYNLGVTSQVKEITVKKLQAEMLHSLHHHQQLWSVTIMNGSFGSGYAQTEVLMNTFHSWCKAPPVSACVSSWGWLQISAHNRL